MNVLDENFPDDQRPRLKEWRIPFRQVGHEIARSGVKDPDIIRLLHRQRGVTFFTQDQDFFHSTFCHSGCCLVWLDVRVDDAAFFLRRFLNHQRFQTKAARMGTVARVRPQGIHFWQRNHARLQSAAWE